MIHAMVGFLLFGACIFMARALYQLAPRVWLGMGKAAAAFVGLLVLVWLANLAAENGRRSLARDAAYQQTAR